ncbi:hypothetical protein Aperf_G00000121740 [Anoplocephala perfoliata]
MIDDLREAADSLQMHNPMGKLSTGNGICYRKAQSSETAAICHAIPFLTGISSATQRAEGYELTAVELINARTSLSPAFSSVKAFISNPTNFTSYPLVTKIFLVVRDNYTDRGKVDPEICRTAAELRRFIHWILTSNKAEKILSNASCVLLNDLRGDEALKYYLSDLNHHQNVSINTTELHEQESVESQSGDDENANIGGVTILAVTGNCFGILLLVLGVMATRRYFSQWMEIRGNAWRITELDIIPPESERLQSFSNLMPQASPRQTSGLFKHSASYQRSPLTVPGLNTVDPKSIYGIYKSVSVTLTPTQIPLSTPFDYATQKTLVELRKVSHCNLLRFYGLTNLANRNDMQISEVEETRELRLTSGDDFSDRDNFCLQNLPLSFMLELPSLELLLTLHPRKFTYLIKLSTTNSNVRKSKSM